MHNIKFTNRILTLEFKVFDLQYLGPLIRGPWSFGTFQVIHANRLRSGPFREGGRERGEMYSEDLMYSGDVMDTGDLNIGNI